MEIKAKILNKNDILNDVELFIRNDVEQLVIKLISIYLASYLNEGNVPCGIISKLNSNFANKTLGSLHTLLIFCANNSNCLELAELTNYIKKRETKGKGVIVKTIQLRNQLVHPKDKTQDEVISDCSNLWGGETELFKNLPEVYANDRDIYFRNIKVSPFIALEDNKLLYFSNIISPTVIHYQTDSTKNDLNEAWHLLRFLDSNLDDPTIDEIITRINNLNKIYSDLDNHNVLKWFKYYLLYKEPFMLLDSSFENELMSYLKHKQSKTLLHIKLTSKFLINEISSTLKIKNFSLNILDNIDKILVPIFIFNCNELMSSDLLNIFYWMTDNQELLFKLKIRVVIVRDQKKLEEDDFRIWGRMPTTLFSYFMAPHKVTTTHLHKLVWANQKSRWYDRFIW